MSVLDSNINIMDKKNICFISATPTTIQVFLKKHINSLSDSFNVYVVADIIEGSQLKDLKLKGYKSIKIERGINIVRDIIALVRLCKYFRKQHFYAIHSVTPKAGLLTAIAGWIARMPNRIHIYTGQVWATRRGLIRNLLICFDKLIATLNTRLLVDGESQRQYLIKYHVLKEKKSSVIGAGSISGVDTEKFNPSSDSRNVIRTRLQLRSDEIVFIFLGRLNYDKGIRELFTAFDKLAENYPNVFLLLVGSDEQDCLSLVANYSNIRENINFRYYGPTKNPELLLQAGDVFCLPTYREGFGSSVIEASCVGLPVICSDTYGVMDAMIDEVTGLRCKVGDVDSLFLQMKRLYEDPELRSRLGNAGRKRVLKFFSSEVITEGWLNFYRSLR